MKGLAKDIELLKASLAEGKDISEVKFESDLVAELAGDLTKRYSKLDTKAKQQTRKIRSTSVSLSKAKLEKEQYKSSLNELQKILDLCRVISSSQDLKDILHHLLFLLSEILPSRGCAVFVGASKNGSMESSTGGTPILSSNFTPQLQQILGQHFEEGIIRWILNERRVCLIPSFANRTPESGVSGDFAVIPLNDNDSNYGFIWIACTIRQEEVTPETSNLIWVLSSHASIAIINCLHRKRMEEKINELKLLTSINALKGDVLRQETPREPGSAAPDGSVQAPGNLPTFFQEFQRLIAREFKFERTYLFLGDAEISEKPQALPDLDGSPFLKHAETRKLFRLSDQEQVRLEAGSFFRSSYPHMAKALGLDGLAALSLSPAGGSPTHLLLGLTAEDVPRIPLLQTLLPAVASQARVVAENLELYDSLLTANRNLTALQWQLVNSGKMAALGQLAGGVAHEINNPLQIMLGRVQMIQLMSDDKKPLDGQERTETKKVKEELNLVTEEILRIRDIVRNLLDFSRQGKRETAFAPVSVNDTVNEVLALLHHQFISNQVEVKLSLTEGNSRVLGNKNQLKQVFINLMINAIHAMEKEIRVLSIGTALSGDLVDVSVRDTGMGISQENLSHIFEPFFSTKSMGTGLGLSISYGLIKDHKGTVEVESQEARGTCFTIRLPKLSEEGHGYNMLVG